MLTKNNGTVKTQSQTTASKGLNQKRYVMVPWNLLAMIMQELQGCELKVVLYIILHTVGYRDNTTGGRKLADAISRSQFLEGIRRADGTIVDRGAGVSERSLNRALTSLESKGYITREHRTSANGRPATTIYRLVNSDQELEITDQGLEAGDLSSDYKPPTRQPLVSQVTDPRSLTPADLPLSLIPPVAQPETMTVTTAKIAPTSAILPPNNPGILLDTSEDLKQERISIQNTQTHSGVRGQRSEVREVVCVEEIDKLQGDERPVKSGQDGLRDGRKVKPAGVEAEPGVKPVSARLDQVTSELLAARISQGKAQSLAVQVIENGHGPGYVGLVLDYISQQKAVKSPPGFLVHLVGTNWQPPTAPTPAAQVVGGTGSARWSLPPHLHDISQPTDSRIADIKLPITPRPDLLDQQIELERGNLAQATNDRQRLIAQARLERYALFKQLLNQHGRVEPEALAEMVYQQRQRLVAGVGTGSGSGTGMGSAAFVNNQYQTPQEAHYAAV